MTSRKNQNAETRKPEILEGYYRVLVEEGFEGSSIGEIARHLDIHPTLILHYFKNKDNFQRDLIDLLSTKVMTNSKRGTARKKSDCLFTDNKLNQRTNNIWVTI